MKITLTKLLILLMVFGMLASCATDGHQARLNHDATDVQSDGDDEERNKYKLTPEEHRALVEEYKELMNPT